MTCGSFVIVIAHAVFVACDFCRTPSCEIIDWKAYNEAGEKAQKDAPKWRVIPQHGPHADPTTAANANGGGYPSNTTGALSSAKPPTGSISVHSVDSNGRVMDNAPTSEGGLRNHFTRQFQTIKSTVVSIVGALSAPEGGNPNEQYQQTTAGAPQSQSSFVGSNMEAPQSAVLSQSAQQQLDLAAKKMAEEKNKRKAIISPEYVQYGSNTSGGAGPGTATYRAEIIGTIKTEPAQFASLVPDPTGRRSSKKILHQTGFPTGHQDTTLEHQHQQQHLQSLEEKDDSNLSAIRCKCTGKCRNARCACVKAGFVCGVHCKCVSCANPFVPMESEGIDIQKMVHDVCLMQFLSKVKDMQELLDSTVPYECCNGEVQVKKTIENGFSCPTCQTHYTYSWCSNRLCNDQKKPRKHCAKCRRCGDHRNEHCDDCNHCYFAGVANSFSCSCKGGKTGANGVKARTVVPNVNRDSDGAKTEGQQHSMNPASDYGGNHSRDENANPHNPSSGNAAPGSASGGKTIIDGLSSSEAEKDDACQMQ